MTRETYEELFPPGGPRDLEDYEEQGYGYTERTVIPEVEDCSNGIVPPDTTNMEGKKKVFVPELISMTKVLFDNYRLPMYSLLNRCLRNGVLSSVVGCRVFNRNVQSTAVKGDSQRTVPQSARSRGNIQGWQYQL